MYELIADGVVGLIAGIAAWKAKKANDHVSPNGKGKSAVDLLEDISELAERNARRSEDLVEWQVAHDLNHERLSHRFMPMLEQLLRRMNEIEKDET